jgi:pyruvate dehydrogenase E2 component (dihydrolipoamide acetyltransferase)
VLVADRLAELGVPLLVVWGEQDRIIPPEHARHVPDAAEVHVLQGSGHSPHIEAAGDVIRVMERFLAGV